MNIGSCSGLVATVMSLRPRLRVLLTLAVGGAQGRILGDILDGLLHLCLRCSGTDHGPQ